MDLATILTPPAGGAAAWVPGFTNLQEVHAGLDDQGVRDELWEDLQRYESDGFAEVCILVFYEDRKGGRQVHCSLSPQV